MYISKIKVHNYKSLARVEVVLNREKNIFVGDNDSGKTSMLEAINLVLSRKLDGLLIDHQLRSSLFNLASRIHYKQEVEQWSGDLQNIPLPPAIVIEAYMNDVDSIIKGKNNENHDDHSGVRLTIEFNEVLTELYVDELKKKNIIDIPTEFYRVTHRYFSGDEVYLKGAPFKAIFVDNTKHDYSYAYSSYVSTNALQSLNQNSKIILGLEYHKKLREFISNGLIEGLSNELGENRKIMGRRIGVELKDERQGEWLDRLTLMVGDSAYESLGFGSQNFIKVEMSLHQMASNINIVLMEEPENNLSYTNANELIKLVQKSTGCQTFISTHSSMIANKLGLKNVIFCEKGRAQKFDSLPDADSKYFMRLPHYDTLRMILAKKIILVEGITDEFIVCKALGDRDDVHVLAVASVAFAHYCELAKILKRKIVIIRDNDGDIQKNIVQLYKKYEDAEVAKCFYDEDESNFTIEVSVLNANLEKGAPSEKIIKIVRRMLPNNFDDFSAEKKKQVILDFMLHNKSLWSYRVAESDEMIEIPEYIKNAINEFN